jgi:Protein of unknown function (DUF2946)
MRPSPSLFRLIAKFLLAAVLLQAIAPALAASMTEPADRGDGWSEICTVLGTKWVKQSDSSSSTKDSKKSSPSHYASDGHCIFCASTEALAVFDVSRLLDASACLATRTYADTLAARVFSGHSILSRAPPQ